MYIKRNFPPILIYFFTWRPMLKNFILGTIAFVLYTYCGLKFIALPWLPISLIGTAVAFFVGFKNNASYDRFWEGRKIWGAINNISRSFTAASKTYILASNPNSDKHKGQKELKKLIYRHLAWLHSLKHAMWQRTPWEHSQSHNGWYRNYFEKGFQFGTWEEELAPFLEKEELEWLKTKKNAPVQLLERQSAHIQELKNQGYIGEFHQFELQKFITELYHEEGKTERIKNTPFPRQYGSVGGIFVNLFTVLLPFGMITEFAALGENQFWLLIPFTMLVGWVFDNMDIVGDYSENPFEGLLNDVPILTIIRNIEIDLKDMLGEKELPEKIKPVYDVLL